MEKIKYTSDAQSTAESTQAYIHYLKVELARYILEKRLSSLPNEEIKDFGLYIGSLKEKGNPMRAVCPALKDS